MPLSALAAMLSMPLAGQTGAPLTLPEAVSMALERNPLHKATMADTRILAAAIREARSQLMPKIMFTESAVRGNDPVFVFGSRLRQQSFTAADFALNKLNTPTPIGNFSSRFSGQWSLFDGLQSWFGVSRAKYMQQAVEQQLDRTDQELVYQAVQAYFGVLLAQRQEQVAEDALKTAQAIEASSRARVESGMVVDSDLLSAQVVTSRRKQELIQMQDGLALARTQLALALGMPADTAYDPQETLEERQFPTATAAELESKALDKRPDLKRVESERGAQAKTVSMAKGALAPRLNASVRGKQTVLLRDGTAATTGSLAPSCSSICSTAAARGHTSPAKRRCKREQRRCAMLIATKSGWKCAKPTTNTTPHVSRSRSLAARSRRRMKACASTRTATKAA